MSSDVSTSKYESNRRYYRGMWWDRGCVLVRNPNYSARVWSLGVGRPTQDPNGLPHNANGRWFYGDWSYSTAFSRSQVQFTATHVEAPF